MHSAATQSLLGGKKKTHKNNNKGKKIEFIFKTQKCKIMSEFDVFSITWTRSSTPMREGHQLLSCSSIITAAQMLVEGGKRRYLANNPQISFIFLLNLSSRNSRKRGNNFIPGFHVSLPLNSAPKSHLENTADNLRRHSVQHRVHLARIHSQHTHTLTLTLGLMLQHLMNKEIPVDERLTAI